MKVSLSSLSPELQARIKAEAFKIDKRSERGIPEERKLSNTYPTLVKQAKKSLESLTRRLEEEYFDESLSVNWAKSKALEIAQKEITQLYKKIS